MHAEPLGLRGAQVGNLCYKDIATITQLYYQVYITYLQEVGCGYVDWIGLAQDRDTWRTLVSAVMNLSGSIKCGEFLD